MSRSRLSAFQKANGAIVLAMITSAERSPWKLFTLDAALIRSHRGHLSDRDRGVAISGFAEVFPLE